MSQKNTVQLNIRIDKELKEEAETILKDLGISPSSAIHMFYTQIASRKEFPLELKRNTAKTVDNMNNDNCAGSQSNGKQRIHTPW